MGANQRLITIVFKVEGRQSVVGLILTVHRTGSPALFAACWHRSSAAWLPWPITVPATIAFQVPG